MPKRRVTIPCGKCLACRVNQAAQWATRAMHESAYVEQACFITLTYANDYLPDGFTLDKRDLQNFMKRLRIELHRKNLGHIRSFFACGEYGEENNRPHYHLILFGWSPDDLVFYKFSYSGAPIFISKFLQSIWGKGFCPVGTLTGGSAAYVARYQKKCQSYRAKDKSSRVPPFFLSSRNIPLSNNEFGALGAQWLVDNHESLRFGYLIHPDRPEVKVRIPEYYFDLMQKWYPDEYERIKNLRYDFAMERNAGCFIVDGPDHQPAACFADDVPFTEDDRLDLIDALGLDVDDCTLSVQELVRMLTDKVRRESVLQDERLKTLKRNYK